MFTNYVVAVIWIQLIFGLVAASIPVWYSIMFQTFWIPSGFVLTIYSVHVTGLGILSCRQRSKSIAETRGYSTILAVWIYCMGTFTTAIVIFIGFQEDSKDKGVQKDRQEALWKLAVMFGSVTCVEWILMILYIGLISRQCSIHPPRWAEDPEADVRDGLDGNSNELISLEQALTKLTNLVESDPQLLEYAMHSFAHHSGNSFNVRLTTGW